jgi:hypothetical protein
MAASEFDQRSHQPYALPDSIGGPYETALLTGIMGGSLGVLMVISGQLKRIIALLQERR